MLNRYYHTDEDYLTAVADAMKQEYDAIADAGFLVQLDCPDLAAGWEQQPAEVTLEDFRKQVSHRLELMSSPRGISRRNGSGCTCAGQLRRSSSPRPAAGQHRGSGAACRPAAICLEAANPRHEHEWAVFRDVRLPDDKVLVAGVIDTTTNFIEHPELVAQRITRFAEVAGKERVLAGADCGFATFAARPLVDPQIAWAKLASLTEGARIANREL